LRQEAAGENPMRISQWIDDKTVGRFDQIDRAQANHVREIARTLRLNIFPEILKVEDCSLCNKPNSMLVHPDMICYSCLLDAIQAAHSEVGKGS
jgi:hypothetical protein